MVGKKSGRALLREEGLQRTDNNMDLTTWPQVNMINQKNYYTDFLKRDDQVLALRLQQEERLDRQKKAAVDVDRARAQQSANGVPFAEPDADLDEDAPMEDASGEVFGSKTIVLHIGSQNMRIGLATDALPKTVPMVIARKATKPEAECHEPVPKRLKLDPEATQEEIYGAEFAAQYNSMAAEFKITRRANKRRVLPNSRELVTKWNSVTGPDLISEHNDPLRIDWTEFEPNKAPDYIVGAAALRIPEKSVPRYRLRWPIQRGWLNERDYDSRNLLMADFFTIIRESMITQLGLTNPKAWSQYNCVFIIPDLYEKVLVATALDEFLKDFGFAKVCFMQESVAATFGAGFGIACVVDIGAQKTSVACVEDGMVIEDSRVNLKYGGYDVTETFVKMMLFDQFHYSEFNLMRRHDFMLAEELKERFTLLSDENISVQLYDFHLRAHGQETRKYQFKIYDEGVLAPMGYFKPAIFDHSSKLIDRRKLVPRSVDLYDNQPNDPISQAQLAVIEHASKNEPSAVQSAPVKAARPLPTPVAATPSKPRPLGIPAHLNGENDGTPRSSVAGSPAPEELGTPQATDAANGENGATEAQGPQLDADMIDRTVPIMPLHRAILTSIDFAAREDDRRRRDLLGSIMLIGGASKTPQLGSFLEYQLRTALPQYPKEILVAPPPKELDPEIIVWKGGSVFGKLRMTNDSWIGPLEYDRLGARILNYKCIWHW
ncbi:hypothetical protein AMS68_000696 [Peltaster fructicola]|uniref:Uncharacterized protein n=1 Tax=Peltaster fructicola TaxID=286661 RepID=A0A6H0XKL9_9PEZI|nr:hypothetical protein AMS68_000696 [Peltaster fructicola]